MIKGGRMSNFICSECGMANIDCGYAGYKTPKEIELEKKVHILNEANMKLENELGHFAKLSKKVEYLQKQVKEANAIIADMRPFIQASMSRQTFTRILIYEGKWGVK